ncbi:MAG: phosphoglycerate mutase [Curvibacter sp. RIFCSPHIGHO2_12_FULL_63_18]|uniref:histidine phosphatase family protein n=1 Tax=Rhodoferax sp. TaxID=50421 RepID=UPI0008C9556D|nr:histidine phosphatase family protein [Rhodoferax sp.]OGO95916.1 MAG: phosphoglycerate mutase [Curvibacter sp. GWA2_63_95]OGP01556.1 MAG: phosphoglycerate mutase [Curvibacter sp. RIFCSPHIGHO2_12_FULL_63_18]HCX83478.1 histidine phosphatase family protein [Rhodoferax sp.]
MGATRIIAVRHGETAWNVDTRIQGQLDIGLNDRGLWQAQRVGLALADEAIDHIYSSDLSRAHTTAQAIAQHSSTPSARTVRLHTGLRERGFGTFEGQTWAAIAEQWPEESRRWKQRDPHFAPPGGETPTQLLARVSRTVNEIAVQHRGEHIVLVAHGGVMDMLYRLATQQELHAPRTWELGNAAINRLLWTPDALTLVGWADTRHLDEAALDESST